MRMEFEYTADDLREAMRMTQIGLSKPKGARFVPFVIFFVGVFGYGEILLRLTAAQMNDKALVFIILPLIPLGLMLSVLFFHVYMQSAGKTVKPWEIAVQRPSSGNSRHRRWRQMGFAAFYVVVACGYPLINEHLYGEIPGSTAFFDGAFAVLAVSSLITLCGHASNEFRARGRGVWKLQTHLHGPFRVDIDDQNMLISSTQWSSRLKWSAFRGFTETQNLIILYLSPSIFHMLPKRAIASEANLNELSRILMQHVQHGHLFPRPSAFPVNPIPAIPVETMPGTQG